jgi:Protein of unknown function (DUF3892)
MIYVYEIHMAGGEYHEHIESVRWRNPNTGASGQALRSQMVRWIEEGGKAYVASDANTVRVGVVDADPPYIRTYADGLWTNNLLSLPRY